MTTERPQISMTNAELAAAIGAANALLSFTSTSTDAIVRPHLEALLREQRDRACARVDAGVGALKAGEASAAAVSAAVASSSGDASPQRMTYIAGKVLEIAGRLASIRTIGDVRNCVLKEEQRGRLHDSLQAIERTMEDLLTVLDDMPLPIDAKAYGASTMMRISTALNEVDGISQSVRAGREAISGTTVNFTEPRLRHALTAVFNSIEMRITRIRGMFP